MFVCLCFLKFSRLFHLMCDWGEVPDARPAAASAEDWEEFDEHWRQLRFPDPRPAAASADDWEGFDEHWQQLHADADAEPEDGGRPDR